ncbi:hypothetical protein FACS1894186_8050 [Alphaproteobacteria bacterium]|nr:hypothetical protein FACS1894186_8050 [Alphaproteobacteria bacterium]
MALRMALSHGANRVITLASAAAWVEAGLDEVLSADRKASYKTLQASLLTAL